MSLIKNSIVVRGYLNNICLQYNNMNYVADRVFPIIDGLSRKTKVAKMTKGAWLTDDASERAPGTAAKRTQINTTYSNLDPITFATGVLVTDEEREDAAVPGNVPIQPDIVAMELMAQKLDLKREVRCSAEIYAANWCSVGAGGEDAEGHWGDATAANDTTVADVVKAKSAIRALTGMEPNKLLLDYVAWGGIKYAPALLGKIYGQRFGKDMTISLQQMADFLELEEIAVMGAIKNVAEELVDGSQFSAENVFGASGKGVAFLYYAPSTPSTKIPSAGYQYRIRQSTGGSRKISIWREDALHSDAYDAQEEVDISAVCLDLGYMFKDTKTN